MINGYLEAAFSVPRVVVAQLACPYVASSRSFLDCSAKSLLAASTTQLRAAAQTMQDSAPSRVGLVNPHGHSVHRLQCTLLLATTVSTVADLPRLLIYVIKAH